MRDDDELGLVGEVLKESNEPADVRLIERRIDLVEHTEGARLHQVNAEEQRERRERALPTGQQVDALRLLPPGGGMDLDRGLERVIGIEFRERIRRQKKSF